MFKPALARRCYAVSSRPALPSLVKRSGGAEVRAAAPLLMRRSSCSSCSCHGCSLSPPEQQRGRLAPGQTPGSLRFPSRCLQERGSCVRVRRDAKEESELEKLRPPGKRLRGNKVPERGGKQIAFVLRRKGRRRGLHCCFGAPTGGGVATAGLRASGAVLMLATPTSMTCFHHQGRPGGTEVLLLHHRSRTLACAGGWCWCSGCSCTWAWRHHRRSKRS